MTLEKINSEEVLDIKNITDLLNSRNKNAPEDFIDTIEIDGTSVEVLQELGSGGTKKVYEVNLYGENYALGICNIVDTPEVTIEKWKKVYKEPQNTNTLRDYGFFVNDLCEMKPVKINGISFSGILMKRFNDHNFNIYDSKNNENNDNSFFSSESILSDEKMLMFFSKVIEEIVLLVEKNIFLGRDSVNLCDENGDFHLYFNDLASMKIKGLLKKDVLRMVDYYVNFSIGAFLNSVSFDTYYKNRYINNLASTEATLPQKMTDIIMGKLNPAKK